MTFSQLMTISSGDKQEKTIKIYLSYSLSYFHFCFLSLCPLSPTFYISSCLSLNFVATHSPYSSTTVSLRFSIYLSVCMPVCLLSSVCLSIYYLLPLSLVFFTPFLSLVYITCPFYLFPVCFYSLYFSLLCPVFFSYSLSLTLFLSLPFSCLYRLLFLSISCLLLLFMFLSCALSLSFILCRSLCFSLYLFVFVCVSLSFSVTLCGLSNYYLF